MDYRYHIMWMTVTWVAYVAGLAMGFWWGSSGTTTEDPFAWSVVKDDVEYRWEPVKGDSDD